MAENSGSTGAEPIPPPEYPSPHFPVVFADGASNAAWGRGVIKWYFYRSEPAMLNPGAPARDAAFAQVVMPVDAFAQMSAFFDQLVKSLVKDNHITQERVDQFRKSWEDHNNAPST